VSGQLNAPAALTPAEAYMVPIYYEAGWGPWDGLDALEKKKNFLALVGIRTMIPQLPSLQTSVWMHKSTKNLEAISKF